MMSETNGLVNILFKGLIDYETQKVVQIHSKKIGVTFRLIQLGIILYVVLWVMIYEKGYQSFDQAVSGVTAKLKGVAFANVTNNPSLGATVWDAADYVIPPQQNSAFFVMTNLIYTPGQMLGRCEESHDVFGNSCHNDSQCHAGQLVQRGSGIQTGKCVNSTRQSNLRVCEIYGWCPTEHEIIPRPHLLTSAENFTVMIKNNIEFPHFRVKRRNILKWMSRLFLKTCLYNPNDDKMKYCPIFRLGDILKYSDPVNKDIWETGGMVSIHIEWNCNLDFDEEKCLPKYVFRRLDDFQSNIAKGWNFRLSQHYLDGGVRKRNLIKAYGIQFFITVYGTGGKFNILTFSMNLGSGLALLGIATMLCDLIVLNTTHKRNIYRKAKIDLITEKANLQQTGENSNEYDVSSHPVIKETKSDKTGYLIIRGHHDFVRTSESVQRSPFSSVKQFIIKRSPLSLRRSNVTSTNFIPEIKSKQNNTTLIQPNILPQEHKSLADLVPVNNHAQSERNKTSVINKLNNNFKNNLLSPTNSFLLFSNISNVTTPQNPNLSISPSTEFGINTAKQTYWKQQRLLEHEN
ncbi:unnamed protein product [Schistosoma turkestanicum]|nr:unnamed protein product [Schistosoma turkestanicum]